MRLLLDTNVLISAFVSRGLCSQLLEHCPKHHELITSTILMDELRGKLLTKFRLSPSAAERALTALFEGMEVVTPAPLAARVSRDPDDDAVIATAVGGTCSVIVTGDNDLLDLGAYGTILIVTPRQFMEMESSQPG